MGNWAIVIGINKYANSRYNLQGAVKDALEMKKWLLDHGNVPQTHLYMLQSDENNSSIGENVEPTAENIDSKIQDLLADSKGKGERLYFYCAGHGLSTVIDYHKKDAIITSDFNGNNFESATLSIKSITEYFETIPFKEQFFFFDTCRNIPQGIQPPEIGEFSNIGTRDLTAPAIHQYIYQATSPGQEAFETDLNGEKRGAFTNALINALNGIGSAKIFDTRKYKYVVKSENLISYLAKSVSETLAPEDEKFVNIPRISGERHKVAEIVEFSKSAIPKVKVEFKIIPNTISTENLNVELNGIIEKINPRVRSLSFSEKINQDEYGLTVIENNFNEKKLELQIYEPQEIIIDMNENQDAEYEVENEESLRTLSKGELELWSTDREVRLEITDVEDNVLEDGRGTIRSKLFSGRYKGKLVLNNGEKIGKKITLLPGERKIVRMNAPQRSRISRGLMEEAKFEVNKNEISVSEKVGPMIDPELSTVLALASRAVEYSPGQWNAEKLRAIGIKGFKERTDNAKNGIHVIFGSEWSDETSKKWDNTETKQDKKELENIEDSKNREFLEKLRIKIWKQSDEVNNAANVEEMSFTLVNKSGIGEYASKLEPGTYMLEFGSKDKKRITFSFTVLDGRSTLFIIQKDSKDEVQISQYTPRSDSTYGGEDKEIKYIRNLSVLEQYYSSNIREYAHDIFNELSYDKWEEPMAGCVSGYMMLKNFGDKNIGSLEAITHNMPTYFGEFPDSYVMRGKYSNYRGNTDDAKNAYKVALNKGVPVFTEGLVTLYYAMKEYKFEDEKYSKKIEEVFNKRIRSSLWTCYVTD